MSKARLVITAVTVEKRPVSEVARTYGVARSWMYALLARHRAEDEAAFEPMPRRPKTKPRHHLLEWLDSDFATPPVARGSASFAFLPSRSESGLRGCDHLILAWSASPRGRWRPPRRCASVEGPKQACRVVNAFAASLRKTNLIPAMTVGGDPAEAAAGRPPRSAVRRGPTGAPWSWTAPASPGDRLSRGRRCLLPFRRDGEIISLFR